MSNTRTKLLEHRRPRRRSGWFPVLLLTAAVFTTGCSLIGVRGPAQPPTSANAGASDSQPPMCTVSAWLPALDTAGIVLSALVMAAGLEYDYQVLTAVGVGGGAIFATSTTYGFATVGRCDEEPGKLTAARATHDL